MQQSNVENFSAGARLVNQVITRQGEMQKANAFRKWSSFTAAMASKANQKVTSQALSLELNATKNKLVALKSYLHKERYPGESKKKNARFRSILMAKKERCPDDNLLVDQQDI